MALLIDMVGSGHGVGFPGHLIPYHGRGGGGGRDSAKIEKQDEGYLSVADRRAGTSGQIRRRVAKR
jgi:hypothetical protein